MNHAQFFRKLTLRPPPPKKKTHCSKSFLLYEIRSMFFIQNFACGDEYRVQRYRDDVFVLLDTYLTRILILLSYVPYRQHVKVFVNGCELWRSMIELPRFGVLDSIFFFKPLVLLSVLKNCCLRLPFVYCLIVCSNVC